MNYTVHSIMLMVTFTRNANDFWTTFSTNTWRRNANSASWTTNGDHEGTYNKSECINKALKSSAWTSIKTFHSLLHSMNYFNKQIRAECPINCLEISESDLQQSNYGAIRIRAEEKSSQFTFFLQNSGTI